MKKSADKIFILIVFLLVAIGIVMFTSASLGILAKSEVKFYSVISSQLVLGLVGGIVAFIVGLKTPYKFWRKYSLLLFILSLILTSLVFVPSLGVAHKGSSRWLSIFGISFQPVELLKICFIFYLSAWISSVKTKIQSFSYSILPLLVMLALSGGVLVLQPDTKSIILLAATSMTMLFVSGTKKRYIFGLLGLMLLALTILVFFKPYLRSRIETFIHPSGNSSTSSYQLQQSLIAIGSGGVWGRGLGQSIQKFNYLPEPQGDSIFSVIGEELGLVGGVAILALYIAFMQRGYRIALNAPDSFAKLSAFGFITIITIQSLMNIASITGVFPLTGVPLVFMSHGGTAMLLSLGMMGIVANISSAKKSGLEN